MAIHSTAGINASGARGLFGLSLCAGAGGLDLGLKLAEPGYRAVGYVERDAYAAAILVARMEEAVLDQAPVWDDVAGFDGRPWRGVVDCLSAGYPCQPFSVAGQRRGTDDSRHLWPHIARVIAECRPEWVFLENVANHLNLGYREVRGELEGLGFGVTEGLFTAAEVGAPHRRQRLFILAHAEGYHGRPQFEPKGKRRGRSGSAGKCPVLGDAHGQRRREAERRQSPERRPAASGQGLGDPISAGLEVGQGESEDIDAQQPPPERAGGLPTFPPGPGDIDGWRRYLEHRHDAEPCIRRGSDGLKTAFAAAGGHWSTFVIWAKNTFTLGRADYQRQYEPILYGWKEGTDHFWCGARDQGDVWFVDKPRKNDLHPTMKPVALVERAIRNSSKSRDIVLDLFGGSGTTLIACEKTGRSARLLELDPKYADVIVRRWQGFTGQVATLEGDGRTFEEIAAGQSKGAVA